CVSRRHLAMCDHAVRYRARWGATADFPGPRDELDIADARPRVALDVVDEILVEIGYPMPLPARRRAGERLGTRERAEGGHAVDVIVRVTDEQRTAIFAGHPAIHREGIERIHER